jgi:hypothetical protein
MGQHNKKNEYEWDGRMESEIRKQGPVGEGI